MHAYITSSWKKHMLKAPGNTTVLGFNYHILREDVAKKVREATLTIKRTVANASIRAGHNLIIVKDELDHGPFTAWLKSELCLSPRTAERYMSAARLVAKYDTVSRLKPSALYALAAPSTPKSVQTAVIAKLENGEVVGPNYIKRMLLEKQLADGKGGKSRSKRGDQEKPFAAKKRPSAKAIRGEDIPDFSADPKHVQMVQMKPEVGQQVMKRLPPANEEFFWGQIRHMGDHLMITKLAKRRQKMAAMCPRLTTPNTAGLMY
jgi:hypothetical protein